MIPNDLGGGCTRPGRLVGYTGPTPTVVRSEVPSLRRYGGARGIADAPFMDWVSCIDLDTASGLGV